MAKLTTREEVIKAAGEILQKKKNELANQESSEGRYPDNSIPELEVEEDFVETTLVSFKGKGSPSDS